MPCVHRSRTLAAKRMKRARLERTLADPRSPTERSPGGPWLQAYRLHILEAAVLAGTHTAARAALLCLTRCCLFYGAQRAVCTLLFSQSKSLETQLLALTGEVVFFLQEVIPSEGSLTGEVCRP